MLAKPNLKQRKVLLSLPHITQVYWPELWEKIIHALSDINCNLLLKG